MVIVAILWGWTDGVSEATAADKTKGGKRASRDGKVVWTSLDVDLMGRLVYNYPPEPASTGGTNLNVELEQLRRERDSVTAVRNSTFREPEPAANSSAGQREALKQQLQGLLSEVARRPKPEPKPAAPPAKANSSPLSEKRNPHKRRKTSARPSAKGAETNDKTVSEPAHNSIDPLSLAQSLLRTGDYAGALQAFDQSQKTTTNPRDRLVIKYFSAVCLRKLGNTQEAATQFREVANSKVDDVFAECARWQLSAQQWHESTVAKIAELRAMQTANQPQAGRSDATGSPTEAPSDAAVR